MTGPPDGPTHPSRCRTVPHIWHTCTPSKIYIRVACAISQCDSARSNFFSFLACIVVVVPLFCVQSFCARSGRSVSSVGRLSVHLTMYRCVFISCAVALCPVWGGLSCPGILSIPLSSCIVRSENRETGCIWIPQQLISRSVRTSETQKAFRVVSTEEARDLAPYFAPEISGKHAQQLAAYKRMPDNVLFRVHQVKVVIDECDMPGPTRRKATCIQCGQVVRDHREVLKDGQPHCRPCAEKAYFSNAKEIIRPDMNWAPEQSERSLYLDHLKTRRSTKIRSISRRKSLNHHNH